MPSTIQQPLLTVRLLESGSGTTSTKLLWLHSSGVSNQQGLVVRREDLLELVLGSLVNVLLVVSNQTLGNGLSDGVNLRNVTTTGDLDSDVDVLELVQASQSQWLVNLETQDLWLHQGDRRTVNLDQTLTGLNVGNGGSGFLLTKSLTVSISSWRFGMGRSNGTGEIRMGQGKSECRERNLMDIILTIELKLTYLDRWSGHLDLER